MASVHADTLARLVLPSDATPKFRCEICGEHFFEVGSQVRHVARCAKRNVDALERLHHMHRTADPLHQATDEELRQWMMKRYGT